MARRHSEEHRVDGEAVGVEVALRPIDCVRPESPQHDVHRRDHHVADDPPPLAGIEKLADVVRVAELVAGAEEVGPDIHHVGVVGKCPIGVRITVAQVQGRQPGPLHGHVAAGIVVLGAGGGRDVRVAG